MENLIADRMSDIPKSFIREMLKIASQPNIISFAGGLPNKDLFPTESLTAATENVFKIYGNDVFQYSNSEGFSKLRAYIAETYSKKNIDIPAKNILITNGAQQGLDLIGKVLLNEGDGVIDHATGVVIGETTHIGNRVKIYQGVTLGARSFPLDENGQPIDPEPGMGF